MISIPDRFNDIGKVKLNINDINLEINWELNPAAIVSLSLTNKAIELIHEQTVNKNALVYLDVSSGYLRQRFECGTNADLINLDPLDTKNNNNLLLSAFKPNAKFEINIVNKNDKSLFRRSPSIFTSEGDLIDMFFIKEEITLGELPYRIIPPERNGVVICTVEVSSICFLNFEKVIAENSFFSHVLKLDAFRTTVNHIGTEFEHDETALEDESYSPWVIWIRDTLNIVFPVDNAPETVGRWINDSVNEFSRYYNLGSKINSGIKSYLGVE